MKPELHLQPISEWDPSRPARAMHRPGRSDLVLTIALNAARTMKSYHVQEPTLRVTVERHDTPAAFI